MSPKSLNELTDLRNDALPTAGQGLEDLPTFGGFAPPPQPGAFRFQLPANLTSIWDPFDTPEKTPPQRIAAIFDADHPLKITQSKDGRYNGEPFQTRINNNERARGKDKSVIASDMDYLLRAFKETTKPASNKAYAEAVMRHAGKEFGADIRWSWRCSKERNIRVEVKDPATGQRTEVKEIEGQKGCGEAFYQEDVPKMPNGEFPLEIQCQCGALLRAFGNLDNFRA